MRGGVLVGLTNAARDSTRFDAAVISILPTLPSTPEGLLGAGAEVRARIAAAATMGEGRTSSGAAKAGVAAATLRGVAEGRGSSTVGTNAVGGSDDEGAHSGAGADAGYGAGAGDGASALADGADACAAALIAAAKTATDRVGDRAPLHVVEIFAGCGGLGHGLASVEGMRSLLAVERDAGVAAIHALNMGADSTVLCIDASTFLEALLRRSRDGSNSGGAAAAAADVGLSREDAAWVSLLNRDSNGNTDSGAQPSTAARPPAPSPPQPLLPAPRAPLQPVRPARPTRVDVLAGGSPCQGFSGANREVNVDVRAQTNVLVSTYVSALERLRPDYGVFENVPPLATHTGSSRGARQSVLRFMLAALLEAGYQCRVAQVDAAQGLCQTRTRLVMLMAAPGVCLPAFPRPLHTAASLDGGVALELHLLTGRGVAPAAASRAPRGASGEGTVADAGAGAAAGETMAKQKGRRTRGASGAPQRAVNETGAIVTVAAHFSAPSPSAPLRTPALGDVLRGLPSVGNDAVARALAAGPRWRRPALPPSPSPFDLALREGVETLAGGRAAPGGHDGDGAGAGAGASPSSSSSSSSSSWSFLSSSSSTPAAAAASAGLLTPTARDHFSRALQGLDLARALRVPTDHPGADWRNLPNVEVLLAGGIRVGRLVYMREQMAAAAAKTSAKLSSTAATARPATSPSSSSSSSTSLATEAGAPQTRTAGPSGALAVRAAGATRGYTATDAGRAVCVCQLATTAAEHQRLRDNGACRRCTVERLIPYMCSHTGSANNQWAGAFGRPSGGAGVGTRVVTMALSTKQGAILHYQQADRIFSVREVARMHGFPDSFRFGVDEALSGAAGGGGGEVGGDEHGAGAGDVRAAAVAGAGAEAGSRSRASAAKSAARRTPAATAVVSVGTDVAAAAAATRGSAAAVARAITVAYHGIGNAVPPPFGRDVARSSLSARGR